jgi:hypothetical protein
MAATASKPSKFWNDIKPVPTDLSQVVALMSFIDTLTDRQQQELRDILVAKLGAGEPSE